MKRKRREEDEERSTGNSISVVKRKKNMENLWDESMERNFLEEMARARHLRGAYTGITGWGKCWTVLFQQLQAKDARFRAVTLPQLKDKSLGYAASDINFSSDVRPRGRDGLIYDAYKLGLLPPPPNHRLRACGTRRNRNQLESLAAVVDLSGTRTNTTNINASVGGSVSGSQTESEEKLAYFLLRYKESLTVDEFATLSRVGKYGVFSSLEKSYAPAAFIDFLKAYNNSENRLP